MFAKNLLVASDTYLRLKEQRRNSLAQESRRNSIISNIRRNSIVNEQRKNSQTQDHHSINNERHSAMVQLQEHLGQPGTLSSDIEHLMGFPSKILDEPDETLLSELKRNNESYEFPRNAKIWIYEWLSARDYVYFLISHEHKVIQSAWYYSFE